MGSPPRRRGKERSTALVGTPTRITPAWAGKRHSMHKRKTCAEDHPRVGGEKQQRLSAHHDTPGSPPRGRGKGVSSIPHPGKKRITPAWAGKSFQARQDRKETQDHPRVGGEKLMYAALLKYRLGSPPRGRGKDPAPGSGIKGPGITPAWAGKRHFRNSGFECHGDHPRVGGEKAMGQQSERTE